MNPVPYSVDEFKPWDFQFAQQLATLETALRQVIEVVGRHSPAMQESLGRILQSMDQGMAIANEAAATATLVPYGQLVIQSLQQDQPIQGELVKLLHNLGILPLVRQMASPLSLPASSFYALSEAFIHEEPVPGSSNYKGLEAWYQELIWNGYFQGHVQLVTNASIFHSNNGVEHALLIGLGQSTALVILLDQPRMQFLHVHRGRGDITTLAVTGYSHLLSMHRGKSPEEIIEQVQTAIRLQLFACLPCETLEPLEQVLDSSLSSAVVDFIEYPVDVVPATVTTVGDHTCTVRRGSHPQLGNYTSFTLSTGEIVLRDDVENTAYFVTGTKEQPELIEVPFDQLPNVSKAILTHGLVNALLVFRDRQDTSKVDEVPIPEAEEPSPGIMELH